VNDDGRGERPLTPEQALTPQRPEDFAAESIGILTQPVDLAGWERRTRERFRFLAQLDQDGRRWAACDPRDRGEVEAVLAAGGFH
jgi:uncharacterized protein